MIAIRNRLNGGTTKFLITVLLGIVGFFLASTFSDVRSQGVRNAAQDIAITELKTANEKDHFIMKVDLEEIKTILRQNLVYITQLPGESSARGGSTRFTQPRP